MGVKKTLKKAKSRRAVPRGRVPREAWKIAMEGDGVYGEEDSGMDG